jgi:transcriptional regulator GlxA family with amidase domain
VIPAYLLLLQARNVMDSRYADPLDVASLARVACCSPAHFIRSFKRAFGETPHRYLTRRRIERAKDLLRETDATVTEVCLAVGFASLGSFSATFAELVGEPPSAYRNRWRDVPTAIPACYTMMWTRPVPAAGNPAVSEKRAGAARP